jgi:hypothetical protein
MLVRYPCSAGVLQRFSDAWFWQYLGDFGRVLSWWSLGFGIFFWLLIVGLRLRAARRHTQ